MTYITSIERLAREEGILETLQGGCRLYWN